MRYLFILIFFSSATLFAQSPSSQKGQKIAALKKFVVLNDTLNVLTDQLKTKLTRLSTGDASTTPTRYRQLLPIIDNAQKLSEAKATAGEIAYVRKSRDISNQESKRYTDAVQTLIDSYGTTDYTQMKDLLKSDPGLKKSYDSLMTIRATNRKQ
ncbi:MAG: hypothetical protein JNK18_15015 [Cyclobacteriaceae bacterium]|nr:hypothetical protein [Cyclobacteriaceae bacterium]